MDVFDDSAFSLPQIKSYSLAWAGNAAGTVSLDVLHLDALHSHISGNKWYKLKHQLYEAKQKGHVKLLGMGGAYSNHLHALAYVGNRFGFETRGLVRGERPEKSENLSPTLQDCAKWGMQLEWLSREDYRALAPFAKQPVLKAAYPNYYVLSEGGESTLALKGLRDVFSQAFRHSDYDFAITGVGTGTTLAGLYLAAPSQCQVKGVSALKGANDLCARIMSLLKSNGHGPYDFQIWHNYHFGGFAKLPVALQDFVRLVYESCGLKLDPVYTAKAFYALLDKLSAGEVPEGSRVLFVHTGGMQGWRGFNAPF
jgi:1-aminocyclopropane-1-carboxylate deaminase/D-cysteine desulfhydrase-like pyridoxal-dependent ACC family enzyme